MSGWDVECRPGPGAVTDGLDVLGLAEIAALLGVQRGTVDRWRVRGNLPEPDGTVGGRPAWRTATITAWAQATGRQP